MTPIAAPIPLPDGTFVVPGNRWDLLDGIDPPRPPSVSVVIPYFEAQAQLDRTLTALARQTHPLDRLQVIVADDGSPAAPTIPRDAVPLAVEIVRQPDAGFRAAAARNLGARVATGTVLCFLDADTVPEPGYVAAISRLPALLPDAVVTGRRRHGDLSEMDAAALGRWLDGTGPGPAVLPEPDWLRTEHEASGNLARIGPDSYRYVISAVLACSRRLFAELGGFDESFVQYGGEDWELAHRAVCAGAVLAHVPDAVAWHDGPSWAERGDPASRRREKNTETAALARLVPPADRGRRFWTGRPGVVVEIDARGHEPAAVLVAVASVLAGDVDAGVWLSGAPGRTVKATEFALEPRVAAGPVDPAAAAGARVRLAYSRPLRIARSAWPELLARVDPPEPRCGGIGQLVLDTGDGVLTVSANRALARTRRWTDAVPSLDLLDQLFGRVSGDAAAAGVSAVPRHPDLAHELKHLRD